MDAAIEKSRAAADGVNLGLPAGATYRADAPLRKRSPPQAEPFAEVIARETGKPMWEARTEVEAVIGKVEISITAYAERTGNKKLDSALSGTAGVGTSRTA